MHDIVIGGSLLAHGVTTAVMGNCGFTLAPGSDEQADPAGGRRGGGHGRSAPALTIW